MINKIVVHKRSDQNYKHVYSNNIIVLTVNKTIASMAESEEMTGRTMKNKTNRNGSRTNIWKSCKPLVDKPDTACRRFFASAWHLLFSILRVVGWFCGQNSVNGVINRSVLLRAELLFECTRRAFLLKNPARRTTRPDEWVLKAA